MMRIGVVGLGNMGRNHVRIFSNIKECNLTAISDINAEIAKNIGNQYGVESFTDYKLMINKIDAVSIAVPTSLHYEIASFFIKNGIHCFIEKPITKTIEEAKELIKLAEKYGVKLMVGHIERFNPAVIKMKEIIDKEMLGKILVINARRVEPFPPKNIDTGIIIDLAIHDIDILRYVYGKEPLKVYSKYGSIKSNYEDYAVILLDFDEGVGCIETNWFTPHKIRTIVVTGTEGILFLDYIEQSIVIYNSQWKIEPKINKEEPLKLELEHFIKCIKENKEPITSGEEGLKNLMVAYRALENK
ncbi:MAG: Gfo/Idh/MocA family oxidoreductase [Candidatus Verstraetearchaeota archaeon]|nr:Gfo/Idh/MocA family oxidoreductase [Candidatus Verstraetearchaeota archaeon]